MNTGEEKRMTERFQQEHTVCFRLIENRRVPNNMNIRGLATDISLGGFRIRAENPIKSGALILLRIPVKHSEVQVPVLAEVRWAKEDANGSCQMGVCFVLQ